MTENEEIERFQKCVENNGKCERCKFYVNCGIYEMEELAIKALEEVQQYRETGLTPAQVRTLQMDFTGWMQLADEYRTIGTVEECREAVEKQTAKKPDYEGDGYSDGQLVYDTWICPSCGQHYEVEYDSYDYCPSCGQKIRLEG